MTKQRNQSSFRSSLLASLAYLSIFRLNISEAWTAEWIPLSPQKSVTADNTSSLSTYISPPRSGHVAFVLENHVHVFGGYAEESSLLPGGDSNNNRVSRYPLNDLWRFETASQSWKCLQTADLWTIDQSEDHYDAANGMTGKRTSNNWPMDIPQQRLAAAAVGLSNQVLLLGGWDSQEAGTGGIILNNIDRLWLEDAPPSSSLSTKVHWKIDPSVNLGDPTSRHVVVAISDSLALVHNHRCTDHILLVKVSPDDPNAPPMVRKQPTTGSSPPSPRGLHAATFLPQHQKMVIFGGAAQSGDMSNECFVLDIQSWEWTKVEYDEKDIPTPRASPCLCTVIEGKETATCVMFGGADRSKADDGVPLHGCDDLWLLHLTMPSNSNKNDKKVVSAKWEPLETSINPPGRNAATLTPLPQEDDTSGSSTRTYILQGGWYPFRTTHHETYILQLTK